MTTNQKYYGPTWHQSADRFSRVVRLSANHAGPLFFQRDVTLCGTDFGIAVGQSTSLICEHSYPTPAHPTKSRRSPVSQTKQADDTREERHTFSGTLKQTAHS